MAYKAAMQEAKQRKGLWLEEEDNRLTAYVTLLGERRWDWIAKASGLKRSGKSCRLRWLNYLRPDLKHGQMSREEEKIILQLHERWGNKWSKIARKLPGRTDNEVKNYWRSHLRKKAQEENMQDDMSNAKPEIFIPKGNTNSRKIWHDQDCWSENILVVTDNAFDMAGSSNSGFPSSSYEARLLDWILWLSDDQSEEWGNSLGICICYPPQISQDGDTILWECSGSIWGTD
ncbi:transcription factor MYB27-like [Malania oleifera]|uniref:transcription factor MYB27-like n=1 Tax=Malania oleifera TaxID=397392 RepID=UPI0025AE7D88|nr:transcription factor MYB27-like [Malania oleifera]